jgi:hypothetical protein
MLGLLPAAALLSLGLDPVPIVLVVIEHRHTSR